eukprot:3474824-Prymnesium_polylepis.1
MHEVSHKSPGCDAGRPPRLRQNEAAYYLLNAFNEAMAAIPNWPSRQPSSGPPLQTLYGRRRLDWFSRHDNGFKTEVRCMPAFGAHRSDA